MIGCGRFISLLLLSIEPSLRVLAIGIGMDMDTPSSSSSAGTDDDGDTTTSYPLVDNNHSDNGKDNDNDISNNLQNYHVKETLTPTPTPVVTSDKIGITIQHQHAHELNGPNPNLSPISTIVHYTCFGSLSLHSSSNSSEAGAGAGAGARARAGTGTKTSSTRNHHHQTQKNQDTATATGSHRHHHHFVEAVLDESMKFECCDQIAVAVEEMCSSSSGSDIKRSTQQFEDDNAPLIICRGKNRDKNGDNDNDNDGDRGGFDQSQMEKKCRDIISSIPQIPMSTARASLGSSNFGSSVPMFHMAIPLVVAGNGNGGTAMNNNTYSDDDVTLVQPQHLTSEETPRPRAAAATAELHQYTCSKGKSGFKWSKSPDGLVYSPLALTMTNNKIASALASVVVHEQNQSVEQQTRRLRMAADGVVHYPRDVTYVSDRFFHASLSSNLSVDGGMHREFLHSISIPMTEIEPSHNIIKGEVYVMLPISEGIFLDLDDSIQDNHVCFLLPDNNDVRAESDQDITQCEVSVDVVTVEPDTVINIEQPSFVSPQHMVALLVSFKLQEPTVVESALNTHLQSQILTLEFISNLHLRYPMPIMGTNLAKNHGRLDTYIPTPFLYDGKIGSCTYCRNDEASTCRRISQYYTLEMTEGIQKHQSGSWGNFSAKVPAGLDNHHDLVMVTTVVVSILGMWKILHDMSRISTWK